MWYLSGLLTGIVLMTILQRDVNKISIESKCPDIHIEQPKVNTVFEESFKSCMLQYEKSNEKLFECQKDIIYYRTKQSSYGD